MTSGLTYYTNATPGITDSYELKHSYTVMLLGLHLFTHLFQTKRLPTDSVKSTASLQILHLHLKSVKRICITSIRDTSSGSLQDLKVSPFLPLRRLPMYQNMRKVTQIYAGGMSTDWRPHT